MTSRFEQKFKAYTQKFVEEPPSSNCGVFGAKRLIELARGNGDFKILDVGSGKDDFYTKLLGDQAVAFDLSHGEDAHDMQFEDGVFDAVFVNHSLEHFLSPLIVLAECNRVTKMGGRLYLAYPQCIKSWMINAHYSLLHADVLEVNLALAGWRIVQREDAGEEHSNLYVCEKVKYL